MALLVYGQITYWLASKSQDDMASESYCMLSRPSIMHLSQLSVRGDSHKNASLNSGRFGEMQRIPHRKVY